MFDESTLTAADVMTRNLVTVSPDTPVRSVAKILATNNISAVPVVDEYGRPLGLVSEGDLVKWRDEPDARQTWWLDMLADGFELSPAFLEYVRSEHGRVRKVMTNPVASVVERTPLREVAQLITDRNIKRVLVLREGRLVGIVSRADLVRAMAGEIRVPAA